MPVTSSWDTTLWEYLLPMRSAFQGQISEPFSSGVCLADLQTWMALASCPTGGDTDFGALWTATQKRLDYYHKIATTQAERSFMYGQIAAGAGFVVVIIAAFIAGFSRSTAAAIASGVAHSDVQSRFCRSVRRAQLEVASASALGRLSFEVRASQAKLWRLVIPPAL
jgi:hypothetical protein